MTSQLSKHELAGGFKLPDLARSHERIDDAMELIPQCEEAYYLIN
jgi:hypothetical protein